MKTRRTGHVAIALAFCIAVATLSFAQVPAPVFPEIAGTTLAGQSISLPAAFAGRAVILCIGFSHASQSQLKSWTSEARKRFRQDPVPIYSIAELEGAPRFVRPMALGGMKSGTPPAERDRFIVVYSKEKELKQAVRFSNSSDSYVLLLDPIGHIAGTYSGNVSDAAITDLANKIHSLKTATAH